MATWDKVRDLIQRGQEEGIFREDVPFPTYFHMVSGTFDQFLLSQILLQKPSLGISELADIVNAFIRAIVIPDRES